MDKWSRKYDKCIVCKGADRTYMAKGMCSACYLRKYASRPENIKRRKELMKQWYPTYRPRFLLQQKITREELHFSGNREAVLRRDRYACTRCGSTDKLVVHHKDGKGRGYSGLTDNSLDNLQTLCRRCHLTVHENVLHARHGLGRWSLKHNNCLRCGTSSKRHSSHGYCRTCIYHFNRERMR